MSVTQDLRIVHRDTITPPKFLRAEFPLVGAAADCVQSTRQAVIDIVHGRDQRLLVLAGPCSVHDVVAAKEYAAWLREMAERYQDEMLILMRCYFEKPRTTVGWKGLINDPHLNGSHDMEAGIRLARELLVHCNAIGLPVATEVLDPITPDYLADTLSWTAIGARTTESQTHREMASGLSMPVGFKNGTDGSLSVAINAMESAAAPHAFRGINDDGQISIISTAGNPDCHLVLRGSESGTNYDAVAVAAASTACADRGQPTRVMIDCSHGNARKDHRRQPLVAADVAEQLAGGSQQIMGLMLESNLVAGNQSIGANPAALTYGQSITDACIDIEQTATVLESLALAKRRQHSAIAV